jgi:DNA polymerase-3 subunit delta
MAKPTFYIFHGEDDLAIEEQVEKMRHAMGENGDLNTSTFDGESANIHDILNAASSYPFLADMRLVIVRGLIGWVTRKGAGETGKKALAQLKEALPNLPDTARLVLVERPLEENNALLKIAKESGRGFAKNFSAPKDLRAWVIKRALDAYGVTIEPRAADALASVIGTDLRRADNELVKLVSYTDGAPITEEHVAALTPYVAEANLFNMIDALAEGRGQVALLLMHRALREKDNNPFSLFGRVTSHFRNLLLAKEAVLLGTSVSTAVGARHPFVAEKFTKQARHFSLDELETIYRRLQQYDADMKIGRIDAELALDLFVAQVTG